MRKEQNKQKEARFGPFFKKNIWDHLGPVKHKQSLL